ncbi:hypothetical protein C8R45DRAFT_434030 [Mycena sanguinolenta]|nr:hypothetical protein C8R45DRAFT_434030 [Mycena sanguinolenta]
MDMHFSVCRGSRVTAALTLLPDNPPNLQLRILDVDLESGHSREIMQFSSTQLFRNPQSADGFLGYILDAPGNNAFVTPTRTYMLFLINLRTEQYIVFDCTMTWTDELHIIPGYLLLVNPQSEPLSVRIYSIPSPQRLWRRLSDFSPENVTPEPVIASTISVERGVGPRNNGGSNQVEVFVTTSLLHQNAYLLRVLDTVVYPDKSIRIASTHRLDLFEQTPQCTLLSISTQSTDGSMIRIVSRAGYNILPPLREGVRVVRLDDGEATFINYDGAERPFQVALPHNGGLVMVHRTHAELLYYY